MKKHYCFFTTAVVLTKGSGAISGSGSGGRQLQLWLPLSLASELVGVRRLAMLSAPSAKVYKAPATCQAPGEGLASRGACPQERTVQGGTCRERWTWGQ